MQRQENFIRKTEFRDTKKLPSFLMKKREDVINTIFTAPIDFQLLASQLKALKNACNKCVSEKEIEVDDTGQSLSGNQLFSLLYQELIYMFEHNFTRKGKEKLLLSLMKYDSEDCRFAIEDNIFLLMYEDTDHVKKYTIWVDSKEGMTVFNSLCRAGHIEVAKKLLSHAKKSSIKELVIELLTYPSKDGYNPLYTTLKGNGDKLECFKFVLNELKQLDLPEDEKRNLLIREFSALPSYNVVDSLSNDNQIDLLTLFLAEVFQIDRKLTHHYITQPGKLGFTILHAACTKGENKVVALFLDYINKLKEDPTLSDPEEVLFTENIHGYFPLSKAVQSEHIEIIKKFLDYFDRKLLVKKNDEREAWRNKLKKLFSAKSKDGYNLFVLAYRTHHIEIINLITEYAIKLYGINSPEMKDWFSDGKYSGLIQAAHDGKEATAKRILHYAEKIYAGDDVGLRNFLALGTSNQQDSALFLAAKFKHSTIVHDLCAFYERKFKGKECSELINQVNSQGLTPINAAENAEDEISVNTLQMYGADLHRHKKHDRYEDEDDDRHYKKHRKEKEHSHHHDKKHKYDEEEHKGSASHKKIKIEEKHEKKHKEKTHSHYHSKDKSTFFSADRKKEKSTLHRYSSPSRLARKET